MTSIEGEFAQAWAEKTGETLTGAPAADPEPQDTPGETVGPDQPADVVTGEQTDQPAAEPEPDGRLRDPDTGQFTTPEALAAKKWGGRFDTPEELEADYQQRLGSMANEIGELRRAVQQQQTPQQAFRYTQQDIEDNPGAVAVAAAQAGDWQTYDVAMTAWADESPWQAAKFHTAVALEATQRQQAAVVQQQQAQRTVQQQAFVNVAQRHTDFDQLKPYMDQAINHSASLLAPIESGDQQQAEAAFEALYWVARGIASAQTQPAPQGATTAQPQPTGQHPLAERIAATVASPTNGGAPQGAALPPNLAAKQQLDAMFETGLAEMRR